MADEATAPELKQETEAKPEVATATPDLVTRVSEVKPEEKKEFKTDQFEEKVKALPPELQTQVRGLQNEIMSGANKKFMEAADIRKAAEEAKAQPWTTDRVQQLLNEPTFVSSAQEVAQKQALAQNPQSSGMQDTEWSALTDGERKQFYAVQQNQVQMQGQMNQMLARQEDQNLMTRYKNYESSKIDQLQKDLIQGNVHATREHLHKVIDYDDAVERAYKMGKEDRQTDIAGKQVASSPSVGVNTVQADSVPEKAKGVSNVQHFINLAQNRIKQMSEQSGRK